MPKKNKTPRLNQGEANSSKITVWPIGSKMMPEALKPLKTAIKQHSKGEFSKVVKICKDALGKDPNNQIAVNLLDLAAQQERRLEHAVKLIKESSDTNPIYHAALENLGNMLVSFQRYEEAVPRYSEAMDTNPNLPQLHNALGIILEVSGRLDEAIASYDVALEINPDFAEAHYNKGKALVNSKMYEEATASFERVVAINPYLENVHNSFGLAYVELKKYADAISIYLAGLRLDPQNDAIQYNLGNVNLQLGLIEDAIDCYRQAIVINPNNASYHIKLGEVFLRQGLSDFGITEFKKAIKTQPELVDSYLLLGDLLKNLRQPNEAIDALQAFLNGKFDKPGEPRVDFAKIHNLLGLLFSSMGKMNEALKNYRTSVEFDPKSAVAHSNYGAELLSCGNLAEAIAHIETAISLEPEIHDMFSNKLYALSYYNGQSAKTLYSEHLEWEKRFAKKYQDSWPQHFNSCDPERPLRVGFVSPDLGPHPVGSLVLGLLENLSVENIISICYSSRIPDDTTNSFRAAASIWHDVYQQSDNVLANNIFADEVDILVDLSGHTKGSRLNVFASKPAPIQMSWAGYVSTTGLSAMDYILSDKYSILEDEEQYYQEKVIRMPDGWVCYSPPKDSPEIDISPCEQKGYLTFGSFNNPRKINEDTIAVWSKILTSVPGSRLMIKYNGASPDANSDRLMGGFRENGVDCSSIILEGWAPHVELLERYNAVDIALDTFPYSGGVTTFEALWMGVPVITVPGKTFASRHSQSHLSTIGLTEFIAKNRTEYVRLAVELADNTERLAELRCNLRSIMAASPSCDGDKFANNFEALMRDIWREWCSSRCV